MKSRGLMACLGHLRAGRWWVVGPTPAELRAFQGQPPSLRRFAQGIVLVTRDVLSKVLYKGLRGHSAAITYNLILSIVPLLAIAFSFFKLFGGLDMLIENALLPKIFALFNPGVAEAMSGYLRGFVGNIQTTTLGATGFLTLLVTVTTLLGAIERSFNDIMEVPGERPLLQKLLTYWLLLTLTPFVVVVSVSKSTELLSTVKDYLPMAIAQAAWFEAKTLRVFMAVLIEAAGFTVLYLVLPMRRIHPGFAAIGGMAAALAFESLQLVNSYASERLLHEASVVSLYGNAPIIAVVLFVWLRLVALILLLGLIIAVSSARCLAKKTSAGQRRAHSSRIDPAQSAWTTSRIFSAVVQDFQNQSRGLSTTAVARKVGAEPSEVRETLEWLASKSVVVSFWGASPSGGPGVKRRWQATSLGLEIFTSPERFVHDILGLKITATAPRPEPLDASEFPAKIRQIISAQTTESTRAGSP